jgi:predicted AlkP superfamily pyrophosphatase or phosphodiesterase
MPTWKSALALAALLCAAGARAETRVVMISIDGLRPEVYRDPEAHGLRMKQLVELREEGTSAARMLPVFPSVTYPAHATLVTGTRPAEHRIVSNFRSGLDWFNDASEIASPTLWQAAEAAGRTTALVTWPTTYGAKVDFLVPENLSFGDVDLRRLVADGTTPGLFEALEKVCGPVKLPRFDSPEGAEAVDDMSECFAAELLRTRRPHLLLVHFLDADHQQHLAGVDSREARHAFERIDVRVRALREAARDAGTLSETVFVVVGDHGFAPVHTLVNTNALLESVGFAKLVDGKLVPSPGVSVSPLAGSAAIYLREGAKARTAERLETALRAELDRRYRGLVELLTAAELAEMGAFPGAALGLVATPGYMLVALDSPRIVLPSGEYHGMHGYLPTLPEMATGFVAAGPGVRRGVELPLVRQLDVAPTLAVLLGLPFESALGFPIAGLFEPPAADHGAR